eukprot:TRINITY_DN12675_c0_g2_i3.p1 TRINITY_DN12675_c0_g2~~TRINITY_DN12675_c0_g2_i3.p1  ORF type:complete len:979 (+),score=164.82 TRINITY_DN12675_c0_g2_i3:241-3177(+)
MAKTKNKSTSAEPQRNYEDSPGAGDRNSRKARISEDKVVPESDAGERQSNLLPHRPVKEIDLDEAQMLKAPEMSLGQLPPTSVTGMAQSGEAETADGVIATQDGQEDATCEAQITQQQSKEEKAKLQQKHPALLENKVDGRQKTDNRLEQQSQQSELPSQKAEIPDSSDRGPGMNVGELANKSVGIHTEGVQFGTPRAQFPPLPNRSGRQIGQDGQQQAVNAPSLNVTADKSPAVSELWSSQQANPVEQEKTVQLKKMAEIEKAISSPDSGISGKQDHNRQKQRSEQSSEEEQDSASGLGSASEAARHGVEQADNEKAEKHGKRQGGQNLKNKKYGGPGGGSKSPKRYQNLAANGPFRGMPTRSSVPARPVVESEKYILTDSTVLILNRGDITKWSVDGKTDAIVNAANEACLGGGGVDGAIHRAAGAELYELCKELRPVERGVRCRTGDAVVTLAAKLPVKYVIHTVGPIFYSYKREDCQKKLSSAYMRSLQRAKELELQYICFCAISCGIYGYPVTEAASVSLRTLQQYAYCSSLKEVHFMLFEQETWDAYRMEAREHLERIGTPAEGGPAQPQPPVEAQGPSSSSGTAKMSSEASPAKGWVDRFQLGRSDKKSAGRLSQMLSQTVSGNGGGGAAALGGSKETHGVPMRETSLDAADTKGAKESDLYNLGSASNTSSETTNNDSATERKLGEGEAQDFGLQDVAMATAARGAASCAGAGLPGTAGEVAAVATEGTIDTKDASMAEGYKESSDPVQHSDLLGAAWDAPPSQPTPPPQAPEIKSHLSESPNMMGKQTCLDSGMGWTAPASDYQITSAPFEVYAATMKSFHANTQVLDKQALTTAESGIDLVDAAPPGPLGAATNFAVKASLKALQASSNAAGASACAAAVAETARNAGAATAAGTATGAEGGAGDARGPVSLGTAEGLEENTAKRRKMDHENCQTVPGETAMVKDPALTENKDEPTSDRTAPASLTTT